jgi:hypothetical protein
MKNLQKKITKNLASYLHQKICANFFSVLQEKIICMKFPVYTEKRSLSVFADGSSILSTKIHSSEKKFCKNQKIVNPPILSQKSEKLNILTRFLLI